MATRAAGQREQGSDTPCYWDLVHLGARPRDFIKQSRAGRSANRGRFGQAVHEWQDQSCGLAELFFANTEHQLGLYLRIQDRCGQNGSKSCRLALAAICGTHSVSLGSDRVAYG